MSGKVEEFNNTVNSIEKYADQLKPPEGNLRLAYFALSQTYEAQGKELDTIRRRFAEDTGMDCINCRLPILGESFMSKKDSSRGPLCRACFVEKK